MKKVLFGIIALSMAAFAANPGNIPTTGESAEKGRASVPVRVIAEVVKPANALVITDEAGTILDELLLDHKIVGGGATGDSVIAKSFKVKVTGPEGDVITNSGTPGTEGTPGTHQIRIRLSDTTTTLTKVGGTNTIASTLRLVNVLNPSGDHEYTAQLKAGEHLGTITSTIAQASVPTAAGAYDNKISAGAMPTLSVTYAASGDPEIIRK